MLWGTRTWPHKPAAIMCSWKLVRALTVQNLRTKSVNFMTLTYYSWDIHCKIQVISVSDLPWSILQFGVHQVCQKCLKMWTLWSISFLIQAAVLTQDTTVSGKERRKPLTKSYFILINTARVINYSPNCQKDLHNQIKVETTFHYVHTIYRLARQH